MSYRKPAQVANSLGFTYDRKVGRAFARSFRGLPEVPWGAGIHHVMRGELDGRALVIFESSYVIMAGNAIVPVVSTVYTTDAPDWPLIDIVPRNALGRALFSIGWKRGLLLENDSFNRAFKVKTKSEDPAIALLCPEMQRFLLTKRNVKWRLGGGRVCLIYPGKMKPNRIEGSIERLRRFWSCVPDEMLTW